MRLFRFHDAAAPLFLRYFISCAFFWCCHAFFIFHFRHFIYAFYAAPLLRLDISLMPATFRAIDDSSSSLFSIFIFLASLDYFIIHHYCWYAIDICRFSPFLFIPFIFLLILTLSSDAFRRYFFFSDTPLLHISSLLAFIDIFMFSPCHAFPSDFLRW